MRPKVCILAAGIGSRLGERSRFFNKGLLRLGNQAAISYNIEVFDEDLEYVIVLGYQGDILKQYIQLAHPDKNITFIETEKWSGPGAGAGYALLEAQKELQCPFYFVCCDSIVAGWGMIMQKTHDRDWVVTSTRHKDELHKYCTVKKNKENKVVEFFDKTSEGTNEAFSGVAFIKSYEKFFEELEKSRTDTAEIRDTPALFSLKPYVLDRTWIDIGTERGLKWAREEFRRDNKEVINNLDKLDEEIYKVNGHIIKYFYNANMVKDRMLRMEHLNGTVPEVVESTKNFYKYKYVPGYDLFKYKTGPSATVAVLDMAQEKLWSHKKELDELETKIFQDTCMKFYYDKTLARLDKLYDKLGVEQDYFQTINGRTSALTNMFFGMKADQWWERLADGIPAKFHGDFNFSNILQINGSPDDGWSPGGYKFVDWRQNFGDSVEYGDVYYDLAKMYHGFLFPHPVVKEGKFYVKKIPASGWTPDIVKTFIEIPYHIEESKDAFEEWVVKHGYDLKKIKVLTGIVLLNMSPLHESPIDEYLYLYAKGYLSEVLDER